MWDKIWEPKDITDIVGNKDKINTISKWLDNFHNEKNKSILINGKNGIGKTSMIKLLLKSKKYNAKFINSDDIKNYRNASNIYDIFNVNNSIYNTLKIKSDGQYNYTKTAIIFDNINNISLTNEKKYISTIFKENNKKSFVPFIFITDNKHNKFTNDLKKNCLEIKLNSPSIFELVKFSKNICKKYKITVENNEILEDLIIFNEYDVRKLINSIFDFKYNYNKISEKNFEKYKNKSINNIDDNGLFETTLNIINNEYDNEYIYKMYESYKVLLPLMIHENYYKKIVKSSNKNFNEKLEDLIKVADTISDADTIETSIYTDQNWYLQHIHGFYTCIYPSSIVNNHNKSLQYTNIKFSADLNKTSSKNINKKNIKNLISIIGKKNINDILQLCRFTNEMYNNNNIYTLIEIYKEYKVDLDVKDFELFLKIDKSFDFNVLSNKEKKNIFI